MEVFPVYTHKPRLLFTHTQAQWSKDFITGWKNHDKDGYVEGDFFLDIKKRISFYLHNNSVSL
jgi:hypothetical protein